MVDHQRKGKACKPKPKPVPDFEHASMALLSEDSLMLNTTMASSVMEEEETRPNFDLESTYEISSLEITTK
jgi:hypothetical protein